jgi:flagellar hook-associated protein 2
MAYNTLLTVTNGLTKVTQTTDKDGNPTTQAGALVADSTLRSMMSQLRSAFANPVQGAGDLKLLTQLGVKTSRTTGMLELDSDQLKKAVAENPAAIKDFFTGKQGMFERIGNITSVYSGKGGLLASREASLTKNTERLGLDQANLDRRIEKLTLTLFAKFNAMDSLVARLNATSQSVMATLNALNKKKDD